MRIRQGFTLIELLIVVVIIGILAAIAIPKFSKTREKAYYSAMKSDLRNLMTEQEIYYSDGAYQYTNNSASLNFSPSSGVHLDIPDASTSGWSATATHDGLGPAVGCAVYYGNVASTPSTAGSKAVTEPGVVTCDDS